MIDLAVNGLVKYFGAELVLNGLTMEVRQGDRMAVVGPNGCGKTTLFRILAGLETKDEGDIHLRRGAVVGYLPQTPDYGEHLVSSVLQAAFAELLRLQTQLQELEASLGQRTGVELERALQDYASLQDAFDLAGGYTMQERLDRIQQGLKIPDSFLQRPFAQLSGGEQSRVGLARTLLQEPDILLLDEPTNHLDLDSLAWLEEFLRQYKGTVVAISHDRYFLDAVANVTLELQNGQAERWPGNYSRFQLLKQEKLMQQQALYENQQKKVAAMEATIKKLRIWGAQGDNEKFFKRAASMEKRLEKMETIDRPKLTDDAMALRLASAGRSGKDTLVCEDLFFGYEQLPLLRGANLHVRWQERLALVGENGTGKTTLLRLLQGVVKPQKGHIRWGSRVQVGWLDQVVQFADESHTILACFRDVCPMTEGQARNILAKFLFKSEDVFKTVGTLSGGERSRLRLCQLMHGQYNVLVLDEPTNHLDILAMEALEEALLEFPGTLLMVSHDRYFINKTVDAVVELRQGRLRRYLGDFDAYWQARQERLDHQRTAGQSTKTNSSRSADTRSGRTKTGTSAAQQKVLEQLEADLAHWEAELTTVRQAMAAAGANAAEAMELYEQQQNLEQQVEKTMQRWLELQEA